MTYTAVLFLVITTIIAFNYLKSKRQLSYDKEYLFRHGWKKDIFGLWVRKGASRALTSAEATEATEATRLLNKIDGFRIKLKS